MVLRAGESKTAEACADLRIEAAASRRICARVFLPFAMGHVVLGGALAEREVVQHPLTETFRPVSRTAGIFRTSRKLSPTSGKNVFCRAAAQH
jgi:hypothetical protein